MTDTTKAAETLVPETTFGQLATGELFKVPGDDQDRTFKKIPWGSSRHGRAADTRGKNDEIIDEFSARDRVQRLA